MSWSGGGARDDGLVTVAPLLDRCAGRFADLVETEPSAEALSAAHGPPKRSGARSAPRRFLTASPPSQAAIRVRNGAARS
ncbi:MAG TPA: hypothetical protein VJY34_21460 [Roseiarcus sp.]|nr:hypothetical protein [Roseiarcus sp.]